MSDLWVAVRSKNFPMPNNMAYSSDTRFRASLINNKRVLSKMLGNNTVLTFAPPSVANKIKGDFDTFFACNFNVNQTMKNTRGNACAICLNNNKSNRIVTNCGHSYHRSCLKQVTNTNNSKCPMCRGNIERSYNLNARNFLAYNADKADWMILKRCYYFYKFEPPVLRSVRT